MKKTIVTIAAALGAASAFATIRAVSHDMYGDTKWIMPDRLHPNAQGYSEIWMPAVLPHFKEICGK